MSHVPATPVSPSNFHSIFNSALDAYKKRTRQDLIAHPLVTRLQECSTPDAILAILREQIPASTQSQHAADRLTKWLIPTVNVLYGFSVVLGESVGIVFSPAKAVFAGLGVLLLAVMDVSASQDILIDIFSRIECFFKRLEIYTGVPPTMAMRSVIEEIIVEVISFLSIATNEIKQGRIKRYLKKLAGNTDIEDSLQRLDKLTREESRMAAAELLRITHRIEGSVIRVNEGVLGVGADLRDVGRKVEGVDGRVQVIDERVKDVRDTVQGLDGSVQDVQETVQDVDDRVQDVRDTVQGVDLKVRDIDGKVQDISDKVYGVDDKVNQINRNYLRDTLRAWLAPPNPSTNHNIACRAHHKGTAEWFFRGGIFNRWKSTGSFLWVHGKPGSGKSILCSTIIQDIMTLRNSGTASVAYFYFDFRDADKQRRRNLLPSLLIQLAARSDPCCDILAHLYSAHDRGIQEPSDHAMTECLKEMLTHPGQGSTYIIIDALDECPNTSGIPSPREEVLDFVNELVDLRLPNLRICVTSRPEIDIQAVLRPLGPHPVSLHEESGQRQDILDYITSVVHSDKRMRRWRAEDKDLVIKTLSEKADGMFRWVFCQLEVLRQSFPPNLRRILEELPESLDGTYERILKEIRKANQRHAYRLMQCLVVAVRPFRVEELAEILAFDFNVEGTPKLNRDWRWEDQEEAVMTACSSLVTIINYDGFRVVQFSHFSVKEFLMSRRLAEDVSHYHILLEPAHAMLAQACLGVLLRLDDSVDRDSIGSFPLAHYAARYWATHARFENVSTRIGDGMDCLFNAHKPHFATWLWIYNQDYPRLSTPGMRPSQPEAVPLYYAALLGFRDLAERLLARHPEGVNAKGGYHVTPLHASASAGHLDVFSLLVEHFTDVDIRGGWAQTPLHRASRMGHLEIGQRLLSHGADANARDIDGWTPLYFAVINGRLEFARMLLEHKAAINAPSNIGAAPLHVASQAGRVEVVRLLLEHGADPNVRDRWGRTPSEKAAEYGQRGVVRLLSEYGAKVSKGIVSPP